MWSAVSATPSPPPSPGPGQVLADNLLSTNVLVALIGALGAVAAVVAPLLIRNRNAARAEPAAGGDPPPELDRSAAVAELLAWAEGSVFVEVPPAPAFARLKEIADTPVLNAANEIARLRGYSRASMNTDTWAARHAAAVAALRAACE